MAEELLVKEPLRGDLLEAGRKLVRLLAQSDFQLEWAFWLYTTETNDWRLVLVTPLVDSEGPKKVYARLREISSRSNDLSLLHLTASVQGRLNPYAIAFAAADLGYDPRAANIEPRLSRQRVGDLYVEDAILYQIPARLG